jgi:hypothetical protein
MNEIVYRNNVSRDKKIFYLGVSMLVFIFIYQFIGYLDILPGIFRVLNINRNLDIFLKPSVYIFSVVNGMNVIAIFLIFVSDFQKLFFGKSYNYKVSQVLLFALISIIAGSILSFFEFYLALFRIFT